MCECLVAIAECLWIGIWPVLSLLLGIVFGTVFGLCITLVVFFITLARTPMHIYKMLVVTVKTEECFTGHWSVRVSMRVVVFLLVPLPHAFFLVLATMFSGTVGILYYIGKTTKIFYSHEYRKTMKKVGSNVRLEPKSHLGKYIKRCQDYMDDDRDSHPTIYFLKGCCATIPGFIIGAFPFIPFSLAIVAITLYRLPVNIYKTMKIALFTVVLEWDLRLVVLMSLPVVHTLFPVVAFIGALFVGFFYFAVKTSTNVFEGESPFKDWDWFQEGIRDYYKTHKEFVSASESYDHPTGIPNGWRGDAYGLPVRTILRWQWNFLVCGFFLLYGSLVGLVGSLVLLIVKFLPSCCYLWYKVTKGWCEKSCATVMGTWPFYVAGIVLLPAGILLIFVIMTVAAPFTALRVPFQYVEYGYVAAWYEPIDILGKLDDFTGWFCGDCCVYPCFGDFENPYVTRPSRNSQNRAGTAGEDKPPQELYWDRFVNQSIKTASKLTRINWISFENLQAADPSAIQSVPGVAILTILADSACADNLAVEELLWKIDGTVCKKAGKLANDKIACYLWPRVLEIKKLLLANKKELAKESNIEIVTAMICSNNETGTDDLKTFAKEKVTTDGDTLYSKNNLIRTKINNLVLGILRVKPYQDRMSRIYNYDYEEEIESGENN